MMGSTGSPTTGGDDRRLARLGARSDRPGDGGRLLAAVMSLNAVFSGLCGLGLTVASPWLARWLGVASGLVAAVGVALIGFAAVLVWLLATPSRLRAGARLVAAADLMWILGAGIVIGVLPGALPASGDVVLAGVTVVVGGLAAGQLVGMAKIGPDTASGTFPLDLDADRVVAADAPRVWEAIADAGGYADYVDGLAASAIVSGEGEGMVRVCRDERGNQWRETCTAWDPGRGYRMTVDVTTYPWHYRMLLDELAQTWQVEPGGEGTRVTLRFTGAVKLGVIGRLAVRVLRARVPVERILDRYERAVT